jgi:gluconolactonase
MKLSVAAVACAVVLSAQQIGEITIERAVDGLLYAEGPVWSLEDFLLFSDNVRGEQRRFTPGKGAARVNSPPGGAGASAYDTKGRLYVAQPRARRVVRADKKGTVEIIADRFEGKRLNAPNDVVVRRDGNVYFTDPAFGSQQDSQELNFFGVFRVTPRGQVEAVARWRTRPNGIALSENGRTLYVTNSDDQAIHAFDLAANGMASNGRLVVSNIPGAPGGIRVDEDGNLFVAARSVFVYSPNGQLIRTIEMPETPSNLAFGDPDFRTLYVTARTSVYRVRVGVKGAVPYLP